MDAQLLSIDDPGDGPAAWVKDSIDIAGHPTRCGTPALADALAAVSDAEVVARLRTGGWRITGKTKLHELAFGSTGINRHDGTPTNPRWPDLVPGGSSSGSAAAVAAGQVTMALGTDTGGSVRIPATCCGVFGLKTSFGLVSRIGVHPATTTLDCVGPLASDMDVLIAAMQAMVPGFVLLPVPTPVRVGVLGVDADPAIAARVDEALQEWSASGGATLMPATSVLFKPAYEAALAVINRENWLALGPLLDTGRVGADVAIRLQNASRVDDAAVASGEDVRRRFIAEIDALLERFDVLALPTMAALPPRVADAGDTMAAVAMTKFVRQFNLSGHPALSLPLKPLDGGPVALQLVARRGADGLLCAIGRDMAARLSL